MKCLVGKETGEAGKVRVSGTEFETFLVRVPD